jgi:hypothetical protein
MKHALLVIILAMTAIVSGHVSPAQALSPGASTLSFAGNSASSFFRMSDGCVRSDTYVFATESLTGPANGPAGKSSAVVLLDYRDVCTGTLLVFGGGSAQGIDFSVGPNLTSAALHGAVTVNDIVSGTAISVVVDVVWTGAGAIERGHDQYRFEDDGIIVSVHDVGAFRHASAIGGVTDGTTTYVPAGSSGIGADIVFATFGQVIINPLP